MRTICSMAAGFGLALFMFAAPIVSAAPGNGPVAVQCQVYADNNFGPPGFGPGGMPGMGIGMKQWAGAVIGRGSNEGEARQDAERQMWGPYGMAPELRDCVPAA
ncbi:hypothetical protein AWB85_01395 [Mycobacteroides immunogenum]|uniref:Secreted protein n=1 Tax=Mycobacteroides immunogenum TaxID=83262 RepID=A0A179VG17_9MYCO|nr:hypothetical protein [Mycobacteroides immunogenum]OAT70082.1 hypothetical protein AWB85_01395 [Mycobacteroides immunogenum]